jgi:uncharacterized protein YktA (UPF0223 family)
MRGLVIRFGLAAVLATSLASGQAAAQRAAQERSDRGAAEAKAQEHFEQGEMYFQTGVYDLAVREYKAAYELFPASMLLYNIGLAYERAADVDKALEHYRAFVDGADGKAQDKQKTMEARARIEALERMRAARLAEKEKNERVAELRARAQAERSAGKVEPAVTAYRDAFALAGDPELLFEIGEVYRGANDRTAAIDAYQRYREVSPAGQRSIEALRWIEALSSPAAAPASVEAPATPPAAAAVTRPAKPPRPHSRFTFGAAGGLGMIIAAGEKRSPVASGVVERGGLSVYLSFGWRPLRWLTLRGELALGQADLGLEECDPSCTEVGKAQLVLPRAGLQAELAPPRQWPVLPVLALGFGFVHVGGFTSFEGSQDEDLSGDFIGPTTALGLRIAAGPGAIILYLRHEAWLGDLVNPHIEVDDPMQLSVVAGYAYGR